MAFIHLMCIDAQNDFTSPQGSLYVKGGDQNVARTAKMIERLTKAAKLSDITTTMDSHRKVDISHPLWWQDEHGRPPAPFTVITAADVEAGKWRTHQPGFRKRTLEYLKALEAGKRYPHVIWPEHCLIGDEGHNIHPTLLGAIHAWEEKNFALHGVVTKGSNIWTEHFSAVQAEVPDPEDITTQTNMDLVRLGEECDLMAWTGEALSHCLANTFRDMVKNFSNPDFVRKQVLLTDATSPVPTFEKYGEDFIREMRDKGMQLSTTEEFLA